MATQAVHKKKVCFLSIGWVEFKPVGRPQFFFFFTFFCFFEGKYGPCLEGGKKNGKKKVSSRIFFSHLAASPETKLFLWTASCKDILHWSGVLVPAGGTTCQSQISGSGPGMQVPVG